MDKEKSEELKYIQEILEKEKILINSKVKATTDLHEKADLMGKANLIKFSQELLRRCFEYNVYPKSIWRRVPMPDHEDSEYRLMNDAETEDRSMWHELPHFRLSGGEVIIG